MWTVAYDGSQWIVPNGGITNPIKSSYLRSSTTIQTTKGDVPITVSLSVRSISHLVRVDDRWVTCRIIQMRFRTPEGLQASYCE